jgi:hypothetical protein
MTQLPITFHFYKSPITEEDVKSAKEIECNQYKRTAAVFSPSLLLALFVFTLPYLNTIWVHVMHVLDMLWVLGVCDMSLGMCPLEH